MLKSKGLRSARFLLGSLYLFAASVRLSHASLLDSFPKIPVMGLQVADSQQHIFPLLEWLDRYHFDAVLPIILGLFLLVFVLFILDRLLKKRVEDKFLIADQTSAIQVENSKVFTKKVLVFSLLFLSVVIVFYHFVLAPYLLQGQQQLVKYIGVYLFMFALASGYLFGSLKRSGQVERLINKLQLQIIDKGIAQESLLQTEKRVQAQSASLANLAATQLSQQVMPKVFFRQMVKQSAETLEVARVSVWLYSPDKTLLRCEALYELATQNYTSGAELNSKSLPSYIAALIQERVVAVEDVYTHVATQELLADYMPHHGIVAILDATIWQDNQMIGVVCHEHVGATRVWTVDEINYAGSLADLARLTFELHKRKQVEGHLLQHQEDLEDIVQRRIASIEHNAKLFRFLVERAPVSILYMNEANEIIEMNPEAEKLSGYSREFAIGKTYDALFSNNETREHHQKLKQKLALGEAMQGEDVLIKCADGSILDLSISRTMELDDEGNPVIISIGQDISKQKALEASLVKAREAAESADRIKSMFVASMSHELRTPLNSIIGFLGVVLQGMSGELNLKQKDQLGRAYHSAKHLLSLISDVIDISKIEAGFLMVHSEKFELAPLLVDVEHAIHHILVGKHLDLSIVSEGEIKLETDRKRLFQIVLNVVSNAVKYTEKGSVKILAKVNNQALVIEVKDTGIGIGEDGLANLFKPFERIESHLKIKTLGTGLGLYLTQKILTQLLGGKIEVQSELDVGSTFTIIVPIKLPESIVQNNDSVLEEPRLEEPHLQRSKP